MRTKHVKNINDFVNWIKIKYYFVVVCVKGIVQGCEEGLYEVISVLLTVDSSQHVSSLNVEKQTEVSVLK